jgi:hypothetical protein
MRNIPPKRRLAFNALYGVELSLTMYKNTTALISDAQPLLAAQVLQLQLITGYVLLLAKSLTDCC